MGSAGCVPLMASSISATSPTLRAIGPCTHRSSKARRTRERATRPGLGRRPTTEQNAAGVRRLQPKSEPVASQACPAATATAEPPEEPPQVSAVFQGLRVTPKTSLKVLAPWPNSGVFDLAMTSAPFRSRVCTMASLASGTWSANSGEP